MFKDRRAAHMAAYLLSKAGGSLNVIKLTKLLYLVERESMDRFGLPISGDSMYSLPHGPVLSRTLDITNGSVESAVWESLIEDRENHNVSLRVNVDRSDLSSLSNATLVALEVVWDKFGGFEKWELVKYTHDECAEWEDPEGSSDPIPIKRVFLALGKGQEAAETLASEVRAQNHFDSVFGSEPSDVFAALDN